MKKNTKNSAKAPKAKEVKPKVPKEVKVVAPKYELLSFEILAVIPTQMYGNISPKISIKAKTIEEAKEILLPAIESIYLAYAEKPRDGSALAFTSKANVTAVEKKVEVPAATTAPKKPEGQGIATPPAEKPKTPAQESADALADELSKSPAYTKAENAVKNCTSREALDMIEDQIQKSVKLTDAEKPMLLTAVLYKRKEFETL